ncbi:recombinase family protein [Pseudomonas veronii]|uniref:recombinase family protein n=1 Tax=Pseudomonas veronii TaxID=76761 RepID=UPI0015A24268|nr:recombinase family protein [Pseudomonas veronii]NWD58636.1 recombinase family protein [Pseudomonas veronii]
MYRPDLPQGARHRFDGRASRREAHEVNNQKIGYARVFTDSGFSGSASSRPGLDRALRTLRPGDKLVVWRLDRLGRSLVHLVRLLEVLGKRDVHFRSLCEHIDTSSSGGRLVFHMMAALAEFERTLISPLAPRASTWADTPR